MRVMMNKKPTHAILLAAGIGSRLGKITSETPKCLISIGKCNILEHWIEKLERANIEHIIIDTHYLSEKVNFYIKNHRLRSRISVFHEDHLLGTAGTLSALRDKIDGSFFLIHADNYSSVDLNIMSSTHIIRPNGDIGTALIFETDDISGCGIFTLGKNNRLIKYVEKPKTSLSNLANGAVFSLSEDIFDIMKTEENAKDFCRDILPLIYNKLTPLLLNGYHIDIGTPYNLHKAREIALKNENCF